eukprot:7022013-Prymnesium_polylepis.2
MAYGTARTYQRRTRTEKANISHSHIQVRVQRIRVQPPAALPRASSHSSFSPFSHFFPQSRAIAHAHEARCQLRAQQEVFALLIERAPED